MPLTDPFTRGALYSSPRPGSVPDVLVVMTGRTDWADDHVAVWFIHSRYPDDRRTEGEVYRGDLRGTRALRLESP